jgi:hypothetical protein
MRILVPLGIVLTAAGLAGLAYCILEGLRMRRANLPAEAIHARLHQLLAINLASVGGAAIGLGMLLVGLLF